MASPRALVLECAHCRVTVHLQLADWVLRGFKEQQRYTCPKCQHVNRIALAGVITSVVAQAQW
jgi:hypothetical protein